MERKIKAIVIHCTAGSPKQSLDSIKAYWKSLGWGDKMGYHYIVFFDGTFEQLTPEDEISYGVGNGNYGINNSNTINVCYVGGMLPDGTYGDTRTAKQKKTLRSLIKALCDDYKGAKAIGHRDLSPDLDGDGVIEPNEWIKLCPCYNVQADLFSYNMGKLFGKKLLK